MQSDQELFEKSLATYQKVVALNYMAHREVYGLLHQVLAAEAPDQFVFADLACGPAMTSAEALRDTRIGRYIGIDISRPSLEIARESLRSLACPSTERHERATTVTSAVRQICLEVVGGLARKPDDHVGANRRVWQDVDD